MWTANFGNNTLNRIHKTTHAVTSFHISDAPYSFDLPCGICTIGQNVYVTSILYANLLVINGITGALVARITISTAAYFIQSIGINLWLTNRHSYIDVVSSPDDSLVNHIVINESQLYGMDSDGTYMWVSDIRTSAIRLININTYELSFTLTNQVFGGIVNVCKVEDKMFTTSVDNDINNINIIDIETRTTTYTLLSSSYGLTFAVIMAHVDNDLWIGDWLDSTTALILQNVNQNFSQPPCFLKGTKIMCIVDDDEQYVNVEDIKTGMLIKNYNGGANKVLYKTITKLNNKTANIKDKLYIMKKYGDMTDDLIVTGSHIIPILRPYGTIILKRYIPAQKHENFKVVNDISNCIVYNLVVDCENSKSSCSIFANGFLCETMSLDSYNEMKKLKQNNILTLE